MADPNGQIFGVARDTLGNVLTLANVYVYERGTTTEVQLYVERGDDTTVTQPLVTDAQGKYSAGVKPGIYDIRIVSSGAGIDRTWSDVYVDQVDWPAYDRKGRMALNLANETAYTLSGGGSIKFAPTATFALDSHFDGGSLGAASEFVWAGAPGPSTNMRITYTGTPDRLVKVSLFMMGWWDGSDSTGLFGRFYISLNGDTGIDASIFLGEDPLPYYDNGQDSYPMGMYTHRVYLMSTNDYVEVFEQGSNTLDINIKKMRFWVE
jgi:hypothetical protein